MKIVPHQRYFFRGRWPTEHHNPHKNIVMRNVKPTLRRRPRNVELESPSGSRDDIWVLRKGPRVYVLSINEPLSYVGLAEYDLRSVPTEKRQALGRADYLSVDPVGEVFAQEDYKIEEMLGSRGLSLPPSTIAAYLRQYLPE